MQRFMAPSQYFHLFLSPRAGPGGREGGGGVGLSDFPLWGLTSYKSKLLKYPPTENYMDTGTEHKFEILTFPHVGYHSRQLIL